LSVPSATALIKARNDKKLQPQQERVVPRAEDVAPEPTAENEPREV
jgi:hypothetical protein